MEKKIEGETKMDLINIPKLLEKMEREERETINIGMTTISSWFSPTEMYTSWRELENILVADKRDTYAHACRLIRLIRVYLLIARASIDEKHAFWEKERVGGQLELPLYKTSEKN